jgi:hypothetical protein
MSDASPGSISVVIPTYNCASLLPLAVLVFTAYWRVTPQGARGRMSVEESGSAPSRAEYARRSRRKRQRSRIATPTPDVGAGRYPSAQGMEDEGQLYPLRPHVIHGLAPEVLTPARECDMF